MHRSLAYVYYFTILTVYSVLVAFTSYGAFWMSYATILLPGSGVLAAFTNAAELESALGIYLIAWFMVTFFLL